MAELEPTPFDAVTATRTVDPASAEATTYVCEVAPTMSAQFTPAESHRRHRYAYEIGAVPDQDPGLAVSVCPTCGVPEIDGGDVFTGGTSVVVWMIS